MKKDLTYIDQVVSYIKKNLRKGYTKESLRWALIDQGHSHLEIDKAFKRAEEELSKQAPVLKTKPKIKYEAFDPKNIKIEPEEKKPFWKKLFRN